MDAQLKKVVLSIKTWLWVDRWAKNLRLSIGSGLWMDAQPKKDGLTTKTRLWVDGRMPGAGGRAAGWGAETKKAPQRSFFVPGAGVEPAQPLQPLVFETSASTDSAIRAMWRQVCAVNELQK